MVLLVFLGASFPGLSGNESVPQGETQGQVRGLFLESRPKGGPPSDKVKAKPSKTGTVAPKPATPGAEAPLAFGYTLFLDEDGAPKRVTADRVFRSGERVRLLLETNRNAYLYVFHQEDGGPATLIFPDARVAGGENRISAHQPLDVPDGGWFAFDARPGDERLTLLVSEQPLASIPRRRELAQQSTFRLSVDELVQLVRGARAAVTDKAADAGAPMLPSEGARGLKLTTADPAPSHVVMKKPSAGSPGGYVVSQVVLKHR